MANPNFPSDGQAERIDALVDLSGVTYMKLAIGTKAVAGASNAAAWHGVATHVDLATFAASDGVVLGAGYDGTAVRKVLVDTGGRQIIVGAAAAGSAVAGNPVLAGGTDGTNARALLLDASGRQIVLGAGANGAALVGAPVRVAGSDGTNTRDIATDAGGHQQVVTGAVTDGAGTYTTLRTPNVFKTAAASASGNTALWTPTSGKKFRLMRLIVTVPANVSLAAGAVFTISFQDATTAMPLAFDIYVPTTAVTTTAGVAFSSGWIDLGNGLLSAAANNVLNVNLSAALATGTCRVTAAGVEE